MKLSALLYASVAVLALASFHDRARGAEPGSSSQKLPNFYRLTPDDPAAEKACTDKGGAVSTDEDGTKICTLARACAKPGGAATTAKLDGNDPAAAQKCKDACGVVSTDKDGAMVCTKPGGG